MKRFVVILLSILYMCSATGATVHIHYCMGKFMSASLHHSEEGTCSKCGMKKKEQKKGCCKDEKKTFKTSTHQLAKISFDFSHALVSPHLIAHYFFNVYPSHKDSVKSVAKSNSPPFIWRGCPLYIQVQNFRI